MLISFALFIICLLVSCVVCMRKCVLSFECFQSNWLNCAVDSMKQPFLNPYLDSVGAPNFQKGCNFATGGTTLLPANAASLCPFSFGVQVAEFVRFKTRALQLLAKGKILKRNVI